jgi:hypothetical protein
MSLAAQAVGAYAQIGNTCTNNAPELTGQALFVCPGGRVNGAGNFGSLLSELQCGTYTAAPPAYANCASTDTRYGCFPKVNASVSQTLFGSGVRDVKTYAYEMILRNTGTRQQQLWRGTPCVGGGTGFIVLQRVAAAVGESDCYSSACPAPGGFNGGYGSCGTDCDCGRCWYCDKSGGAGTCRYGGEGPYGCYRGCG